MIGLERSLKKNRPERPTVRGEQQTPPSDTRHQTETETPRGRRLLTVGGVLGEATEGDDIRDVERLAIVPVGSIRRRAVRLENMQGLVSVTVRIMAGRSETHPGDADVARVQVADGKPDLVDELACIEALPACAPEDPDEDLVCCKAAM